MRFIAFLLLAGVVLVAEARIRPTDSEGLYSHHLQGIDIGDGAIYWSFTTELIKTDHRGNLIKRIPVPDHHGDLYLKDNRIYVAVNLGHFNQMNGADSWVYVYDADTLDEVERYPVPELIHGAGGIAAKDDSWYVVGGLPSGMDENYVYEYDQNFKFIKRHVIESGNTFLGIQTILFYDGHWYFGCYGSPQMVLIITDENFKSVNLQRFNAATGIAQDGDGRLYVGISHKEQDAGKDPYYGRLLPVYSGERGELFHSPQRKPNR